MAAVRADRRRDVVAAAEAHAHRLAACGRHPVDLRAAAAVRGEINALSVRREHRLGVDAAAAGQPLEAAAVGVDDIDLRGFVARQHHRHALAVRRPGRRRVGTLERGDLAAAAIPQRLHIDDRLLVLERHVGEARAVRRKPRRDDRFAGTHDGARVLAVGIGHPQLIALALLLHVGDPAAERARDAGQFFVHDVGDAVGDGAPLGGCDVVAERGKLGLLDRVEQVEADLEAPARQRQNLADQQGVRPPVAPDAVGHLRRRGRLLGAAGAHQLELAAAQQIAGHDVGQRRRRLARGGLERHHRDGDLLRRPTDHLDFHRCTRGKRRAQQDQKQEMKQRNGTRHG